jgi:hypothetical protein
MASGFTIPRRGMATHGGRRHAEVQPPPHRGPYDTGLGFRV